MNKPKITVDVEIECHFCGESESMHYMDEEVRGWDTYWKESQRMSQIADEIVDYMLDTIYPEWTYEEKYGYCHEECIPEDKQ